MGLEDAIMVILQWVDTLLNPSRHTPLNRPISPAVPIPVVSHLLSLRRAHSILIRITLRALDARPQECRIVNLATRPRTQMLTMVLAVGAKGPNEQYLVIERLYEQLSFAVGTIDACTVVVDSDRAL